MSHKTFEYLLLRLYAFQQDGARFHVTELYKICTKVIISIFRIPVSYLQLKVCNIEITTFVLISYRFCTFQHPDES